MTAAGFCEAMRNYRYALCGGRDGFVDIKAGRRWFYTISRENGEKKVILQRKGLCLIVSEAVFYEIFSV